MQLSLLLRIAVEKLVIDEIKKQIFSLSENSPWVIVKAQINSLVTVYGETQFSFHQCLKKIFTFSLAKFFNKICALAPPKPKPLIAAMPLFQDCFSVTTFNLFWASASTPIRGVL